MRACVVHAPPMCPRWRPTPPARPLHQQRRRLRSAPKAPRITLGRLTAWSPSERGPAIPQASSRAQRRCARSGVGTVRDDRPWLRRDSRRRPSAVPARSRCARIHTSVDSAQAPASRCRLPRAPAHAGRRSAPPGRRVSPRPRHAVGRSERDAGCLRSGPLARARPMERAGGRRNLQRGHIARTTKRRHASPDPAGADRGRHCARAEFERRRRPASRSAAQAKRRPSTP